MLPFRMGRVQTLFGLAGLAASLLLLTRVLGKAKPKGGIGELGDPVFGEVDPSRFLQSCGVKPATPTRIASDALVSDELLFQLVRPPRLVAVSYVVDWPSATPLAGHFPRRIRRVRGDAGQLLEVHPDLAVLSDYTPASVFNELAAAGLCVLKIPSAHSFGELFVELRKLGDATGARRRASAIVAAWQRRLAWLKQLPKLADKPRALLVQGLYGYGPGTLQNDCLARAGLTNALKAPRWSGTPALNPEAVLSLDPDLVFVAANVSRPRLARLAELPAGIPWGQLRAVQKQRTFVIPAPLMASLTGFAISACEAYAALARGQTPPPSTSLAAQARLLNIPTQERPNASLKGSSPSNAAPGGAG